MIRLACAVVAVVQALAGCSVLIRSDEATFAAPDAKPPPPRSISTIEGGAVEGGPSPEEAGPLGPTRPLPDAALSAPACRLLGSFPIYVKPPAPLSSAMYGGHLSASGHTLVVNAFLETPGVQDVPGAVDGNFCPSPEYEPPNMQGTGALRVYEGRAGTFAASHREIRHDPASVPLIPRDRLKGIMKAAVIPTHPSAVNDSWLVVGDSASADFRGSLRYWPRNVDGGGTARTIVSPAAEPGTFGQSLALQGDTLVVGAPSMDSGDAKDVGAAYVYELGPEGPRAMTPLKPLNPHADGWFGSAVALSSRWIVVAAPGDDSVDHPWDNTVYVFERHGDSIGATPHVIPRPKGAVFFGTAVALQGDWLAIGAPGTASENEVFSGTLHLYHYSPESGWPLEAAQVFMGPNASFLGWAIAFAPGALIVTSPWETGSAGAFRLFEFGAEGIEGTPCTVFPPNPSPCDVFGTALAVNADFVAVGAPREDGARSSILPDEENALLDTGAVYLYPLYPARSASQSGP